MTARALDEKNRRRISVAEITEEATVGSVKKAINRHLHYAMVKDRNVATSRDYYFSLALSVKDQMITRWFRTQQHYYQTDPKVECFSLCCNNYILFIYKIQLQSTKVNSKRKKISYDISIQTQGTTRTFKANIIAHKKQYA